MLMLCSAVPVFALGTSHSSTLGASMMSQTPSSANRDGWSLQWSHNYGGNGHAQFANVVGDLDNDGVNEVVIGGYESQGTLRIISYVGGTYVEEYSYSPSGGGYNCPSGATIADLDGDGTLELIVSWAYTSNDGVYAYHWDGSTMTTLDEYHGVGVDFLFDVNSCDYNGDGSPEVVLCNAPNPGGYTVTGLQWINGHFVRQASWTCPGGSSECPMVAIGDVDDDGALEIVANVADAGTWSLSWNEATQGWDSVPVWTDYGSGAAYGCGVADIDGDGTPEIGTGMRYTPTGYLFEWDGSTFQKVWEAYMPGGAEDIIESVALGDADNDGQNEMCIGGGPTHIIGWDGSRYYFEANLTESTGREAGMNIGDFDSDGLNELKACEILSATGYEYIWKHTDSAPPVTTCTLTGTLVGSVYVSDVTVTLTATDPGSGVAVTKIKMDGGAWTNYTAPVVVTTEAAHVVSYYSIDKEGNIEQTKTTPFTIWKQPIFDVKLRGGLGVTMKVTNVGPNNLTAIHYTLKLEGAHVFVGKGVNGVVQRLNIGQTVNEKMPVFGFGKVTVKATVGAYTFNATGSLVLFAILGVH